MLAAAGICISMDGRGRWVDNAFIERLWHSPKHENIYLKSYLDGCAASSLAVLRQAEESRKRSRHPYGFDC
jgi:transposase InsO family protein